MEEFDYESCVQGYHIYKSDWNAIPGEIFPCEIEEGNTKDRYAVSIVKRYQLWLKKSLVVDQKDQVHRLPSIECLKYLSKAMSDHVSGRNFSMKLILRVQI